MPRKRLIGKRRRAGFAWESLGYIDRSSLEHGRPGKWSLSGGPHSSDMIQTEDDLCEAWEQNRGHFLRLQDSPAQRVAWSHRPGERPALFWKFDAPRTPRDGEFERDALRRMGLMDEREAAALKA